DYYFQVYDSTGVLF
nr:immunoglobulin light chain junction region [Macaca mulatta]